MEKIEKFSRYLSRVFYALLFITPLYTIGTWVFIDSSFVRRLISWEIFLYPIQSYPSGTVDILTHHFSAAAKFLCLTGSLIELLPMWLGFLVLAKLFHNYHQQIVFSTVNTLCYYRLGLLLCLNAIMRPLADVFFSLGYTIQNPPGQKIIGIAIDSTNIESIIVGLLVVVISWIMHEAQKIHEEQTLVI